MPYCRPELQYARMALTYLPLAILVISNSIVNGDNTSTSAVPIAKAILDPKRRNVIVDEAFLEQKDILLEMLETKLKEVRDKKKKKPENSNVVLETIKCETLPSNVDLNLKGTGIIAVGETDVRLKFGESGNSTLKLNASGISNVGKTYLDLEIGDGTLYIPSLNHLFSGQPLIKNPCLKQKRTEHEFKNEIELDNINLEDGQFRRSLEVNGSATESPQNVSSNTVPINGNNITEEISSSTTTISNTDTTQDYVNE